MKLRAVPLGLSLVLACALPASAREGETVGRAMVQPLHDLSLIRKKTPDILLQAAADPYAAPQGCPAMRDEVRALDEVLGEDLAQVNDKGGSLVTDAVKSAVRLPFGGVVRRLTGAHKRDKAYEDAVIAGVVRRAFLKGALTVCAEPAPVVAEAAGPTVPPVGPEPVTVAATP